MSGHQGGFDIIGAVGVLIGAGVIAVAADLMTPYGPIVLTLAAVCGAFALVAAVLSILPPLRPILRPAAGVLGAVMAANLVLVGLWYIAPKPAAQERGVIAALLPFGETLQAIVVRDIPAGGPEPALPAPVDTAAAPATPAPSAAPMDEKQKTLLTALASADPATRLRGAMAALNERDPAVLAGVVETLYRSPDPAVRQAAVKRLIAQRRGARLPLIVTPANAQAQAFATALQAGGLTVKTINETTGALEGGLCGPAGMTGAVARSGVTMSGACKVGDATVNVVLSLQPTDDFQLSGEARDDKGRTASVRLPLL